MDNFYIYFHLYIRPIFPSLVLYGILIIMFVVAISVIYSFVVNLNRADDDPEKKDYRPLTLIVAPITTPLFLILGFFFLFLRAILFITFLIFFTTVLVLRRKPIIFVWLDKWMRKIGDPLLKINNKMIELALSPWNQKPRAA